MSKKGMYRHVVLFQFNEKANEKAIRSIESAFRDFCAKLDFVKDFEWGINSSTENLNDGFTHCFIVTFADETGRNLYLPHPEHLEFCRVFLDPYLKKACVLDFTGRE